jgi:hypothetical protein
LLISLANTQEVLFVVNRPARRPSYEGATARFDAAIPLCRQAGFRTIILRGDTDLTPTGERDRWDADGVRFYLGIDALPNLKAIAAELASTAWPELRRPPKYPVKTKPRRRPEAVKEQVVREKGYTNIRLRSEQVAAFTYRPGNCQKSYRIVVLRKQLALEKKGVVVGNETRYFFYITHDETSTAEAVVAMANDRCQQENLIEQRKNGVRALRAPVNTLEANGA